MNKNGTMVLIKGAGDLASGVAYRLFRCGFKIVMTEISKPLVVRRKVAFAEAVFEGSTYVEGVKACLARTVEEVKEMLAEEVIPVIIDPESAIVRVLKPEIVVDARMAKRNLGTTLNEAPLVIGLGPGFTAGVDVHAVIETKRGHNLGRVIYDGTAEPDTGVPGDIGGYTKERLLRAPEDGIVNTARSIGEMVGKGQIVAYVGATPVRAEIQGVLRGMIKDGIWVSKGTKIGDIDPRTEVQWDRVSDKALAVAGGVLEAVISYTHKKQKDYEKESCFN